MRRLLLTALVALWMPATALAATWNDVSLVDQMCAAKEKVTSAPDKHPVSCLIQCSKSGYGVLTPEGKYLKFDKAGNDMALAALKKTKQTDHVRVNVTGEQKGDEIAVSSLKLNEG